MALAMGAVPISRVIPCSHQVYTSTKLTPAYLLVCSLVDADKFHHNIVKVDRLFIPHKLRHRIVQVAVYPQITLTTFNVMAKSIH